MRLTVSGAADVVLNSAALRTVGEAPAKLRMDVDLAGGSGGGTFRLSREDVGFRGRLPWCLKSLSTLAHTTTV
jgi:hypothetical protein